MALLRTTHLNTRRLRIAALGLGSAALVMPLTTVVSHSFGRATYPLLLPAIKDDILGSNTYAGVGATAIYFAYLMGVTLVATVSGRFEPITIMRTGIATTGSGLLVLALAPNGAVMLMGLVLAGAGGAGIWITAPLLATEGVAPHRRGLVIGVLTGSIGVATSSVALGTRLARSVSGDQDLWRPVYAVEAIIAGVILVVVIVAVRARATARVPGRPSLAALRSLPSWKAITAAYVCFGAIAAGYSSFLAEALEEDAGLDRDTVALVYVALGFSSMIGAPLTGWASDRFGRRIGMVVVMSSLGVGSMTIALGSGSLVIAAVILFGGMWSSYPTLTATYVRDHLDDRTFGSAYGTMTMFYGIVAIVPPSLFGILADATGSFRIPYLIVAVAACLGLTALSRVVEPARPST